MSVEMLVEGKTVLQPQVDDSGRHWFFRPRVSFEPVFPGEEATIWDKKSIIAAVSDFTPVFGSTPIQIYARVGHNVTEEWRHKIDEYKRGQEIPLQQVQDTLHMEIVVQNEDIPDDSVREQIAHRIFKRAVAWNERNKFGREVHPTPRFYGKGVELYFEDPDQWQLVYDFRDYVDEPVDQHALARENKSREHRKIGISSVIADQAVIFQADSHSASSILKKRKLVAQAEREIARHPQAVVKKTQQKVLRRNKESITGERQQHAIATRMLEFGKKSLMPEGKKLIKLDDMFMETFFTNNGALAKDIASFLTDIPADGLSLRFAGRSFSYDKDGKPVFSMEDLTEGEDMSGALRNGDVKNLYEIYKRRNPQAKEQDVTVMFAQVVSEGKVVLSFSYTPPELAGQFSDVVHQGKKREESTPEHRRYPKRRMPEKGIALPTGDLVISWKGKGKLGNNSKVEILRPFFQPEKTKKGQPATKRRTTTQGTFYIHPSFRYSK